MIALIALGGNIPFDGNQVSATIALAIDELFRHGLQSGKISKIYQTPCFPAGAGPDFANAAIAAEFDGSAAQLLQICHDTERAFGRQRNARWSARTLDIDLLAFGDQILPDIDTVKGWIDMEIEDQKTAAPDHMILPHPRIQDRGFVLIPLMDVAPDWRHPILGKTVSQMVQALPNAEKHAILPI